MFNKRNGVFIKLFGVLILLGMFFIAPANSNVASKEYADRKVSNMDNSTILKYGIRSAFIENAATGDEVSVAMNGIRFLARKAAAKDEWGVYIKNETNAAMSFGITFSRFYTAYQGHNITATIPAGAEYNPSRDANTVGATLEETAFVYVFDLKKNYLYRFSATVHTAKAIVVVEKLY